MIETNFKLFYFIQGKWDGVLQRISKATVIIFFNHIIAIEGPSWKSVNPNPAVNVLVFSHSHGRVAKQKGHGITLLRMSRILSMAWWNWWHYNISRYIYLPAFWWFTSCRYASIQNPVFPMFTYPCCRHHVDGRSTSLGSMPRWGGYYGPRTRTGS